MRSMLRARCFGSLPAGLGVAVGVIVGSYAEGFARHNRLDRLLLGRLASARMSGDRAGVLDAIEGVLGPLWSSVRAQAAAALAPWYAQEDDLDDIAVASMMRLLSALASERDLMVPFVVLVKRSVDYAVRDFRRVRAAQAEHEELREPAEMPEPPAIPAPGPVEQADVLQEMLVVLSERDQRIVIEREVLDLPVALVAKRQRISPDAVRQVCSRALARLRDDMEEHGAYQ